MYFLLEKVDFQPAMLVYRRVVVFSQLGEIKIDTSCPDMTRFLNNFVQASKLVIPISSMYGIFTYIWLIFIWYMYVNIYVCILYTYMDVGTYILVIFMVNVGISHMDGIGFEKR